MSIRAKLKTLFTAGKGVALGLPDLAAGDDPMALFGEWYRAAEESGMLLPETMILATSTPAGRPSARAVLLKRWGAEEGRDGFVFFTNYGSRKAKELDENPFAALLFHWPILERQVRVEGAVERVSEEESAAYFRTRARGSRIGAWASYQSEPLADRTDLARRVQKIEQRFAGQDIPLPPFWGGYRVTPELIEFWQGRVNRLHDRISYRRTDDGWHTERLWP
jgi:pyridoxamine 5'-phosphate oxidase